MEYFTFNEINITQLLLITIFIIFIIFLIKIDKMIIKTSRINKYSLDIKVNNKISIINNIYYCYKGIIRTITFIISNIPYINKYASRYNKYIEFSKEKVITAIDYISNKMFISILTTALLFIYQIIINNQTNEYIIILAFILGYIIPDIYNSIKLHNRKKQIEKDLLKAIIIMNKSFKSGKSIVQAIEIVANEINGPISDEFNKIAMDISYGLSIDNAFKRFKQRINMEEIGYIASVLAIANKTGGNIIKVFTSIEKNMYNKDRLKKEFNALTASSNITIKILIAIPFIITFIIYALDNTYFNSLFESIIGYTILSIIFIILLIYLILVNKILRVRV
jgi:Flp pilus assembly protein TadB